MQELLEAAGLAGKLDLQQASSLDALQTYTHFFRSLLTKLPPVTDNRVRLDRFLKVYGNRHAYKLVSPDFKTEAPSIPSFSWQEAASKRFRLNVIANKSNADVLFACFLLTLEASNQTHEKLTIGHVVESLPLGTGGICNPASYHYAMIALFGGQKQRDFWIFHKPGLQHAFTEQANQSTRNMRYFMVHSSEAVTVNPKYVLQGA